MSEVQNERFSFDTLIKEVLEGYSDGDVVQFINTLYGENLPLDSTVTRLATESNLNSEPRRSDVMFRINDRLFHAEVQSTPDSDIVFRMFEYGFRSAVLHGKTSTKDTLFLKFPAPIVIYLRNTESTPKELKVCLELPNIEPVEYTVPTKRIGDYTYNSLVDGHLFAMAPFYPMKYEQVFTGNHSEEVEKQCYDEVTQLTNKITKKVEDGEINKQVYDLSLSGMEQVMQYIQSKAEILNKEGFDMVMQNIQQRKYVLDQLNWKEEGKIETAKKMKKDNLPLDTIRKYTDLPVETIQSL